ncbi:hypothetical protein LCGC14_1748380 [marine sediment metagenome]|uniref:Uncharacterized protein n=1 Tax=marine sediment metagenome TaxID=412755 RepID=A0A0F9H4P1_9ZZZZ
MKYGWKFDVVNRPSKEKDGITNVSQDFSISSGDAGDVVPVGSIVKSRGNASYVALNLSGDRIGVFNTRSQAAHALRKHRVANAAAATETIEGEPEIIEPATEETESTDKDLGGEAA